VPEKNPGLTPEQRSLRARLAAQVRWGKQSAKEGTKPARDAFLARFEKEADPNGELPEDERLRRATSLRKAYFTSLAYRSSLARKAAA